jgi:hypothetical protein
MLRKNICKITYFYEINQFLELFLIRPQSLSYPHQLIIQNNFALYKSRNWKRQLNTRMRGGSQKTSTAEQPKCTRKAIHDGNNFY